MLRDRCIVVFKHSKVQPPVQEGDISDITDGSKSLGVAIPRENEEYFQIRVPDLSEEVEEELRSGLVKVVEGSLKASYTTMTEARLLLMLENL